MSSHSIEDATVDPTPPRRRRRVRLSVRVLMLIVLVFAVWLGGYVQRVRQQQAAVDAIKRVGSVVIYDWLWDHYNPDIDDYSGRYRAPRWLARLVPVDYVANVISVRLGGYIPGAVNPDDTTLAHLEPLARLEELSITNALITDHGLAHLSKLPRLRQLSLQQAPPFRPAHIGATGIANLHGVTSLRTLMLTGIPVSDDSVLALEKGIPAVHVSRDADCVDSNLRLRALDDLEFARSQPVPESRLLLEARAEVLARNGDSTQFIATVDALCDLEASDTFNLVRLAEARAYCLALLEPHNSPRLAPSDRQRLQQRCAAGGVAALSRAVDLGYDNIRRLDGEFGNTSLRELSSDAAYRRLIKRMKAKASGR
jgi:hypothetical protein